MQAKRLFGSPRALARAVRRIAADQEQMERRYFRHGPHLAVFRRIPDLQTFWDDHWQTGALAQTLEKAAQGRLGVLESTFLSFLPRNGTVLEAGCGTGRYVLALRARGYDVVGIDYAEGTLREVKTHYPGLPVSTGDIYAIDVPDGSYAGYISIGVLEHSLGGLGPGLREAARVLSPGGVAIISLPYLNAKRKRRWASSPPRPPANTCSGDWRFYQDYVDVATAKRDLLEAGFQLLDVQFLGLFNAFSRDWRLGRWLARRGYFSWRVRTFVKAICLRAPRSIRFRFSHEVVLVSQRA